MHRSWVTVCGLGAVLFGLVGCQSNKPLIKRPELVEEYVIPPSDDPRFSDPHYMYDKKALNQYAVKPDSGAGVNSPKGMGMSMPGMPSGPRPGGM